MGMLPARNLLADWLFESPNVERCTEPNGNTFTMRTCLVDLSEHGLILCLSAGSALKLTADHPAAPWVLIDRQRSKCCLSDAGRRPGPSRITRSSPPPRAEGLSRRLHMLTKADRLAGSAVAAGFGVHATDVVTKRYYTGQARHPSTRGRARVLSGAGFRVRAPG